MKKKIKSWGASKAILFTRDDCDIWDLKAGDIVEFTIKNNLNWPEMRRRVEVDQILEEADETQA